MCHILKLTFFLCVVVSFSFNTFGQHQLGVKVSGGLSEIIRSGESSEVSLNTSFVPSGQGGVYYNLSLGEKASVGAELLFSQIEGKEEMEMDFHDAQGNDAGHSSTLTLLHISYLSMPVYVGFNFNKLTVHGGFQVSYALAGSGREKSTVILKELQEESYSYDRKIEDLNYTTGDFGPKAGIFYQLTDKLSIEGTYYYGLTNIQKGLSSMEMKIQQMTVGIRYGLWN